MSTNWYYSCQSHVPSIASEYMFTYPQPLIKALERRAEIVAIPDWVMDEVNTEWDAKPWHWLRQHATCNIQIFNEYGKSLDEWNAENDAFEAFRADRKAMGLCHMKSGVTVCNRTAGHDGRCFFGPKGE